MGTLKGAFNIGSFTEWSLNQGSWMNGSFRVAPKRIPARGARIWVPVVVRVPLGFFSKGSLQGSRAYGLRLTRV